MFAALLIAIAPPLDFYADGPYDQFVPRPESTLGYPIGSRITTYRDQERVVTGIANAASARVRTIQYGKSVEGRPLRVFAISSAANIKRLDAIRADMAKLADGDATPERLANTPAIVWINECIHGNEPASFESAMPLLYNLAASKGKAIEGILDDVVVIVNPVYNPDGHERFAVWYNSVAVGAASPQAYEQNEPGVIHGRSNHYRFDMNRDRVSFSQDETRQEVAEFLKWNPQVYVDQHGQVETYFFPPNPMSVNANVDRDRLNKWTDVIGRETAKAFDAKGYLYYVKDFFDLYYPGYLDSYASLAGSIGMTHETDGGKQLAKMRNDGTVVTFRQGIEKHFTSALAVIRATAKNRKDLVGSFASFKRKWVTGEAAGKFRRVVVESDDPRAIERLRVQLVRAGVKSAVAAKPFTQNDTHDYWSAYTGAHTFPAGALVVDIAQTQGAIAKSLLEPGSDFEPEFLKSQREKKKTAPEGETYPGPEGSEFYDLTGWSLPYAHNLKAWWCESAPKVETVEAAAHQPAKAGASPIGYAMRYVDQDDALAAMEATAEGVRGLVTTKPMRVGQVTLGRGTFLFLAERNEEGWIETLTKAATKRGATLIPLTTAYPEDGRVGPGSDYVKPLRAPKIGVFFGRDGSLAQAGSLWYLMDREFKFDFTPLNESALNGNLSEYTALVVPSGIRATATPKLKEWVQAGGNLVVLENLGWAVGSDKFVELEAQKDETPSLPGSLFRATLDPRSALSFGYPIATDGTIQIAVPISGDSFYKARKQGGSIVTISPDAAKSQLLSGWTFGPESEKALAGTVWVQDAPLGNGHAVLFTQDPTARAMWPGLHKMLLNAMFLGG